MTSLAFDGTFTGFRDVARAALAEGLAPAEASFADARAEQRALFAAVESQVAVKTLSRTAPQVTASFLRDAELVALHREPSRWALLYRLLHRSVREGKALFARAADPDVRALALLLSAVRRDIHKMHAFVRLGRVRGDDGSVLLGAYYEPDHRVAEKAMPLFVDRMGEEALVVATPDVTLRWDRTRLQTLPGIPGVAQFRAEYPALEGEEDFGALFATYYANIFNPARLNERAMRAEMPKRFWKHMPETQQISSLMGEARARARDMVVVESVARVEAGADLAGIERAVHDCSVCPHAAHATQGVMGSGPAQASIVLVGEQPGDEEDVRGLPFVGPAGKVLRELLREAGLDESTLYLTNAVKHFTWEPHGKLRLHKKPSYRAVKACHPLLVAELQALRPRVIVCLGATASQSLLGAGFRLQQARDKLVPQPWADALIATYHPSAILRASSPSEATSIREQLVRDLRRARALTCA